MLKSFSKYIILILCTLSFINCYSQITNSYFWKGTITQNISNKKIYSIINDSIYMLDGDVYTYKGIVNKNTQSVIKTIIDSSNTIWIIYNNSITFSSNEGKAWSAFKSPPLNISNAKLYGDYIYINDYTKLYRINIKIANSNWELIYSGDRLQDYTVSENGTLFVSIYDFSIYKSKDAGKSWVITKWNRNVAISTPGTLEMVNNRLFVGTWWHGVYYSDDEGDNWLGSLDSNKIGVSSNISSGIASFIFSKGLIFAYAGDQQANRGFYYSKDIGKTFSKFNTNLSIWDEQFLTSLIIKDSLIYINDGYRGFFLSKDTGRTWKEVNNGYNNKKPHNVCKIVTNTKGHVYAFMAIAKSIGRAPNSFWGIMKSVDSMKTWNYISDNLRENNMSIQDFIITKKDELLVSGYTPGTILKSFDDGKSWVQTKINSIRSTVGFFGSINNSLYGDTIYAGTWWDGVIKSIDGGNNWIKLTNGLNSNNDGGTTSNQGSIDIYNNGDTVYTILQNQISYDGIYRSLNSGNNWVKISSNPSDKILKLDSIIVITKNNSLFSSINEGSTWQSVTNFSKINQIGVYNIDGNPNLASSSSLLIATNNGLFTTKSIGDSIKKIANNNITAFDYNVKNLQINFSSDGSSSYDLSLPQINGPQFICMQENIKFLSNIIGGKWSVNNNTIAKVDSNGVLFANAIGKIIISYSIKNTFGYDMVTSQSISIKPIPSTPSIIKDSIFLVSSSLNNNLWYKNGLLIDSISNKIKPSSNGSYTLRILGSACLSIPSAPYYYIITDIIKLSADEFIKLAPNPFINQLNFDFVVKGYQRLNIEAFDIATGSKKVSLQNLTPGMPIYFGQLSAGTYFIKVSSKDGKINYQFKMIKL